MLYCPNCGLEVAETDLFCRRCGTDLAKVQPVSSTPEGMVKALLSQRVDGIKRKNTDTILSLIDGDHYSKYDDWPPWERQAQDALKREAEAFEVLKDYAYETSDWKIDIFNDAAAASFTIRYRGSIRGRGFDIKSRVSAFLIQQGDKWKLVHEHWSRFPESERRRWLPI